MANSKEIDINFTDDKEEIAYLKKRLEDYQNELEEFQESSRELEAELEAQLSQSEKRNHELVSCNSRLTIENENLKSKLSKVSSESQNQILELQKELGEVNAMNERLTGYIRELEQSNDDLERAKRALDASLEDFESRLNQQIERNVLLENEIGEKEELQVLIQRLKDEARDLRQELTIQQTNSAKTSETVSTRRASMIPHRLSFERENGVGLNNINTTTSTLTTSKLQNNSIAINSETQTNGTPTKRLNFTRSCSNPVTPSASTSPSALPLLSPSTRISALNIVSDLLRKVGALESKLASCRNLVPAPGVRSSHSFNNNNNMRCTPTAPINGNSMTDVNANN